MIPKIIHYCWFGRKALPQNVQNYIQTWKQHMPDWEIYEWNEDNFEIATAPIYAQQAYQVGKYAFVSDYVRLWALERLGGVYFDTDVEVLKPFDNLLDNIAFVGLEESLAHLPGTCVMGCEAHCLWVKDMLSIYDNIQFLKADGTLDLTTNVQRMGNVLIETGFVPSRNEQLLPIYGLKVYTHDYFSPITSTRVMRKTKDTYCIHHFAGTWTNKKRNKIGNSLIYREIANFLVQVKRRLKGIK